MNTEYIDKVLAWNGCSLKKNTEEITIHVSLSYLNKPTNECFYVEFDEDGTALYEFQSVEGTDEIINLIVESYLKRKFYLKHND